MKKIKVMSVFGTRPEAIKMAPLVKDLAQREGIESLCCVTAKHREMLDSVMQVFDLKADSDLDIMTPRQTLSTITCKCLTGMDEVIDRFAPDMILVHGDTSTTFAGALSAFYHKVKIGHVDLLQREHTPEQEREYLAVLDRQAHKLKKLTVDLVEMSKASTGNIPCHIARRSVRELIDQTVGEYAEKLSAARLEPVVTLPDEDLYCLCDGALMWRVLDNLLSNACKYACAGTRLYIAARREGETVAFSFKNISRDALNIDPDELLERFVRGDSSRTTEGSGLGLNIAKSLVELQKGTFTIAIDGDLFKVGFILPRTE